MTHKLLHIAPDEKFIDSAIDLFESTTPGQHTFVILLPLGIGRPTLVKQVHRITCFHDQADSLRGLVAVVADYDAVVIHYLNGPAKRFISMCPTDTRLLWLAWGFDLYHPFPIFEASMFQSETKKILREMAGGRFRPKVREIKTLIKAQLFRLSVPFSSTINADLRVVRRMHACATVLPDEWPIVRQLGFKGRFFRFNYGWVERLLPAKNPEIRVSGSNILVGNSSTPTCNHVEIFEMLSKFDLGARKVIVPLSYGDLNYRPHILRRGRELLGTAFMPLENFMPIADYMKLLESCGTVILNHHRQQAVGNIIASIHMGAKVFLNECNPCHAFFSRIGVRLFSLQRDRVQLSRFDEGLADHIVQHNRSCLRSEYSKEVSMQRTRSIVQYLFAQGGT